MRITVILKTNFRTTSPDKLRQRISKVIDKIAVCSHRLQYSIYITGFAPSIDPHQHA